MFYTFNINIMDLYYVPVIYYNVPLFFLKEEKINLLDTSFDLFKEHLYS